MGNRLQDKVTIITGAGSGLGRAMTIRFAAEGARVVGADITGAEKEVAAEAAGEVVPVRCDVTDEADVVALVDACRERFGRLDVVGNNAGINVRQPAFEVTDEAWDLVLDTNLKGLFFVAHAAARLMHDQDPSGGSVVNVASISAFRANPGTAAYGASKAALMQLTRVAALDYAKDNIRVNAVCPGTMATAMSAALPEERRAFLAAQIPLGRVADPDEVVTVALFLASDEASYVTGQGYLVDGGRTAG